jgi:pimeloyl-ACP methyl ester carboxylesterase
MYRRKLHLTGLLIAAALLVAFQFGCWMPPSWPEVLGGHTEKGLIFMLPGIDGQPASLQAAYEGIRDGGVEAEIRAFDWGPAALTNLTNYERNRAAAASLAEEIVAFQDAHPDVPVELVGYSGGGGMVLLTLESLPAGHSVRKAIIVQAGVSPDYDLTAALSHIEDRLVSFCCPTDWFVLGVFTELMGTIDRAHTESAGKDGFDTQRAIPDPSLAGKLEQVCWTPDMREAGHLGGHNGMFRYEWNRQYVAPYLLLEQDD